MFSFKKGFEIWKKEEVEAEYDQANKGGKQAQRWFYWLKLAVHTKRYGMARCCEEKSTRSSTILEVSFSIVDANLVKIPI